MSTDSTPIRLTKSKKRVISAHHHDDELKNEHEHAHEHSAPNLYSSYRKPKIIRYATIKLLAEQAPQLIKHIYEHQQLEWFRDPEIRVGLAMKLLHHSGKQYDEQILTPILDDIEEMMHSESYLQSTGQPEARLKCLEEEYHLLQKFLKLDDNISLNTDLVDDLPINAFNQNQLSAASNNDNDSCSIM